MKNIVGVKLKNENKILFFNPGYLRLHLGQEVIVETESGEDFGIVSVHSRLMPNHDVLKNMNKIVRLANPKDIDRAKYVEKIEQEAFELCKEKIIKYKLDMNLVEVDFKFDNTKLLFYFTSEGRVDFRDLAKYLAGVYRTRIELRQLGVRDEVKRIGGNGVCGRELCCCSFLNEFDTVSIKMAKEQNISLNPAKISGNCGRLMCCLKYEQEVYEEKLKNLPNIGALVKTEDGNGVVQSVETLKEVVLVKFKDEEANYFYKKYNGADITILKDGTPTKD